MSAAEEIREQVRALEAAANAWRSLPWDARAARVGTWLDAWCAPHSEWQKRLVDALPRATGFSAAMVREGVERGFAVWRGAALRATAEREGIDGALGDPLCAVVLAGAIPMPSLLAWAVPLATRERGSLQSERRRPDHAAPRPRLPRSLRPAPRVVRRHRTARSGRRPRARRLSLAAHVDRHGLRRNGRVFSRARRRRRSLRSARPWLLLCALRRRRDARRGTARRCAQPRPRRRALGSARLPLTDWPSGSPARMRAPPTALPTHSPEAFEEAEAKWPRGRLGVSEGTRFRDATDVAALRPAPGRVLGGEHWCVVRETSAAPGSAVAGRFLRVHPANGARRSAVEPPSRFGAAQRSRRGRNRPGGSAPRGRGCDLSVPPGVHSKRRPSSGAAITSACSLRFSVSRSDSAT